MLSVQEQTLAAFKTRLDTLTADHGVTVYRTRDAQVPHDKMPAVNQVDGGWDVILRETGQTLHTQRVDVECFVGADRDHDLGPAITELGAQVVKAVLADHTLGGTAQDVRVESGEDPIYGSGDGQTPVAAFTIVCEIDFWTREADPYAAAP